MYASILVPLDGSKRAEAILPHVEQLARCFNATILLLSIVEPDVKFVSPFDALPDVDLHAMRAELQEAEAYLARLQHGFRRKGLEARTIVTPGQVINTILSIADHEDAGLIAMASHGRSGLSRMFYGSVASGVLQRVERPILLIRSQ